jgi:predicted AAA+ superfamily ATPase
LGEALQLLCEAGLTYKCYQSASNGVPLSAEIDIKKFKVYFVDIGLAVNLLGINPSEILKLSFDKLVNKGGLAEQFVGQEMISHTEKGSNPGIYYWHRDALNSSAEIDFVTSVDENVVPIEVKSGKSRGSKSLFLFCQEKKIKTALMVSQNQFKKTKTKEYELVQIPFYGLVKSISGWLGEVD